MEKFIHLRCHTNYSIGQGYLTINKIKDLSLENKLPAIAITDTNNMFGAREFSLKLSNASIQPIIGIQILVRYNKIEGYLVLFAKSEDGYKNLLKIHDNAYYNKYNEKLNNPSVPFEDILKFSRDVIVLTGGSYGLLADIILKSAKEESEKFINALKENFDDDCYIELNRFFHQQDKLLEDKFLKIAEDFNIAIVATNDVFCSNKEDYEALDILTCIGQGVISQDENRKKVPYHCYFKSPKEMIELFKDLPEAIENTVNIAKKCCFFVDKKDLSLPSFAENEEDLIKDLSNKGLKTKLQEIVLSDIKNQDEEKVRKEYQDRLDYELGIITKMNFSGYFLIVSDFINWAKKNDIPVGPGRGSGAGSLVAWCLGITDVDPIKFSLLFERFLNPERISMPDFDIDFCQDGRDRVIKYVQEKYGKRNVAHIITFGSLQAKAAIKDVGRALGMPYNEVNNISKRIPFSAPSNPITLSRLVNEEDDFKELISQNTEIKKLFDIALKLEGLYRNTSTHAAGVIISKEPLNDTVSLYYDEDTGFPSVGFSMKYIEDIGLVKFDFLALKALTIIKDAVDRIEKIENKKIDILKIVLKDKGIATLLASGNTLGLFQLESRGMTEVIKQIKPEVIEEIIAIISLYRPGPMDNIPLYIENRNSSNIEVLHPKMKDILKETAGIMIYQEQVMQVAQVIAGYSLGQADILRRAMGKKDPQEMAKQRDVFIKGALEVSKIKQELAVKIFNEMERFAGYGFNKSHATAYALISWQSAFLKAYYPAEFLSSTMSGDINSNNKDQDRFSEFIIEAKKFDIETLPPSVNYPALTFTISKDNQGKKAIRYALFAIKGIGEALVINLVEEVKENGKFKSLEDFLVRVNSKSLNKKALEALIKSGSLDELYSNRNKLMVNLEYLISFNSSNFANKSSNQMDLLGGLQEEIKNELQLKDAQEWQYKERAKNELEYVGYFTSGHPLLEYKDILKKQKVILYKNLIEEKLEKAYLSGFLMKIKKTKSRNGTLFANLTFYDELSIYSIMLFGANYEKYINYLEEGENYIIEVSTKDTGDEFRIFINNIFDLNSSYQAKKIHKKKSRKPISINIKLASREKIALINTLVEEYSGKDNIYLKLFYNGKYYNFALENITLNTNEVKKQEKNLNIEIIK